MRHIGQQESPGQKFHLAWAIKDFLGKLRQQRSYLKDKETRKMRVHYQGIFYHSRQLSRKAGMGTGEQTVNNYVPHGQDTI